MFEEHSQRFTRWVASSAGCWEWQGGKDQDGYGIFSVDGVSRRAHRYAWEQANGHIPTNMYVCHKCDNPSCVRVEHLFLGTCRENTRDAMRKRRHAHGERQKKAKLTNERVRTARLLHSMGVRNANLARWIGVAPTVMLRAIRGRTWKHVEITIRREASL